MPRLPRCLLLLLLLTAPLGLRAAEAPKITLICAAYPPEFDALKKVLSISEANGWTHADIDGVTFWKGTAEGKPVVVFETWVSMVNAAYRLQVALDHFPVKAILFSGVAGGTDPALHVGDVVIPETWAYHGEDAYLNPDGKGGYVMPDYLPKGPENFGMMFPTGTIVQQDGAAEPERKDLFPADPALLAAARKAIPTLPTMVKQGRPVEVSVGGTGVTATVFLDNAAYREWVFKVWKARCTDMESTALAHVAYANKTPILIIRGLSDLAGGQPGKNPIDNNESPVSEIAARVLDAVLREAK